MPVRPELRKYYGRRHRARRLRLLIRAGYECERCGMPDRPMGLRSTLDTAQLDGNPANEDDDNGAILCHRCHKQHDYKQWAERRRATAGARKDLDRPILQFLEAS